MRLSACPLKGSNASCSYIPETIRIMIAYRISKHSLEIKGILFTGTTRLKMNKGLLHFLPTDAAPGCSLQGSVHTEQENPSLTPQVWES